MSDLANLMQVAPGSAAFMMGQNNAQSMQSEGLRQQQLQQLINELSIKNGQSQVMNPLLAQHQDLQNQGLSAELPGISADSSMKQTNATKAAGTLSSDIDAGNSNNQATILANQGKQLQDISKIFGTLGSSLDNVPDTPGARSQAVMQSLQGMGLSPDDPKVKSMLGQFRNIPSSQLPQALRAAAEKSLTLSEQYLQSKYTADSSRQTHLDTTAMNNRTQLALEDKRVAAGKYNKKQTAMDVATAVLKSHSALQTAEIYDAATDAALHGDDPESAKRYSTLAQNARARGAEDAKNRAIGQPGVDPIALSGLPGKTTATSTAPVGDVSGQGGAAPASQAQAGRIKVVGPDGKRYTLPAEQLKDAEAQGYKKVQ